MSYDSRAVANAVLDVADHLGLPLTHMVVHKVMYYAHGWHLARTSCPLIKQDFEAWKDGPVQRLVWDCFKLHGALPISSRAFSVDLVTQKKTIVREVIDQSEIMLLEQIVAGYGHLHAFELSRMTHEPGGPWDRVWNAPNGRVSLGMRISNVTIRDHFRLGKARNQAF